MILEEVLVALKSNDSNKLQNKYEELMLELCSSQSSISNTSDLMRCFQAEWCIPQELSENFIALRYVKF